MTAKSGHEAHLNSDQVTWYDSGMCQKFTRECWEVGSLYGSAQDAWDGAYLKHKGDRNPPEGAPCYYSGGSQGHGHAVVYQGQGKVRIRSTDAPSSGQVSDQDLAWPEHHWGLKYLGWTGDINGVTLPLGSSSGDSTKGLDDVGLQDEITEWSPDDGSTGDTTVGKTLNQARGYAEDAYDRVVKLQSKVNTLEDKIDKILNAVT
jgi:hypothetical protein